MHMHAGVLRGGHTKRLFLYFSLTPGLNLRSPLGFEHMDAHRSHLLFNSRPHLNEYLTALRGICLSQSAELSSSSLYLLSKI